MQIQSSKCTVCQSKELINGLSFGIQPPSNRFLSSESEYLSCDEGYSLSLGYCKECGTIQLVDRMPVEVIRPRYDWLIYNEPEGHLNDVVTQLQNLHGITPSSRIIGVTYKDESTIRRLSKLGFIDTACIDHKDLDCKELAFGLETIQSDLTKPQTIMRLKENYGDASLLLVRHIVEHASDASAFIRSLRGLLSPGGYMMFELPDSEKFFQSRNYSFIWEEHISYFTEATVHQLAKAVGAKLIWIKRYSYQYEDSLVAVFRFDQADEGVKKLLPASEVFPKKIFCEFTSGLNPARVNWRKKLQPYALKGDKIAVFGAGHLAVKFINFYELADMVECVVDDFPNKVGMLMPGSRLPIVSSSELLARGVRVCISTLSPESEVKVRQKLASYFETGGHFIPAFEVG